MNLFLPTDFLLDMYIYMFMHFIMADCLGLTLWLKTISYIFYEKLPESSAGNFFDHCLWVFLVWFEHLNTSLKKKKNGYKAENIHVLNMSFNSKALLCIFPAFQVS